MAAAWAGQGSGKELPQRFDYTFGIVRFPYYTIHMIASCRDKETEKLLNRLPSRKFGAIAEAARIKLAFLDSATDLRDLSLPSLRFEKLSGDRKGQYSIRINNQYRICFVWSNGDASEVEITDYH